MIDVRQVELRDAHTLFNHAYKLASRLGEVSPDFVLTKERLIKELFSEQADWQGLVVTKNLDSNS